MPDSEPFWWKIVDSCFTWILVVAGWMYVKRDTDKREKRSHLRSIVDDLSSEIRKLEEDAHKYFASPPGTTDAELLQARIKSSLNILEKRIGNLKHIDRTNFQDISPVVTFRSVLTGQPFEAQGRQALPPTNAKFLEVSFHAAALIEYLEQEYAKQAYGIRS